MPKFKVDIEVTETGRKKPQYTLDSDLNGELTIEELLAFTKAALIVISDEVLREEQAAGFDKEPILAVDGKVGKPIQAVNPLGSIEFTSRKNIGEIILAAYEAVLERSKVLTGRYKSSHYVFLNGAQIANDWGTLNLWLRTDPDIGDKDIIRIVNIQPYARKLERLGVTAQRTSVKRVISKRKGSQGSIISTPNGTYFLAARSVRAKYKRNSNIAFSFISGADLGISGSFKGGRKGKNSSGRPYLYPSITIRVQGRGIL
jgi:hypothetical protein